MRIKQRWVWVGVFVVVIGIVIALLGTMRQDRQNVRLVFLGYTNLPNSNVRSALLKLTEDTNHSSSVIDMWVEIEGPQGLTTNGAPFLTDTNLIVVPEAAFHVPFTIDVPLDTLRWRGSWTIQNYDLRTKLLNYAETHNRFLLKWLDSLPTGNGTAPDYLFATHSSPWLTNSP